jgi:hypothetical protein
MFQMGFYLLGEGIHGELDKVRGRFCWEGCAQSFKYHMMKWENVCRPKSYGGLGIINTRYMNISLLLKLDMEALLWPSRCALATH